MGDSQNKKNRWIVGSLSLSMLLASLGVSTPNVALPSIAQNFGATFSEVQTVLLSYLLVLTVMVVTAGRLGDKVGRKKVLLFGISIFSLGAAGAGFAPNLLTLIFARAVQGFGGAVIMALTIALISDTVQKDKLGRAMGLMGTVSAIGTASGPTLGGAIVALFDWRGIFLFTFSLGLLCLSLTWKFVPSLKKMNTNQKQGFDFFGTLLLALTLGSYSLAVSLNSGHFEKINWILILTSFLAGAVFLFVELKVESPLVRLDLFKNRELSSSFAMNIIVSTVMMSTLIVGPFYLSRGLGLGPFLVGAVMSVGPLISIATGFPAGRLVDSKGSFKMTKLGLLLMSLGAGSLCIFPQAFGVPGYIFSILLLSPGYQLFQAANNTSVMSQVSQDDRGVFSGLLSLSRNLGLITGASVMGSIFSYSADSHQISSASSASIVFGMRMTFSAATLFVLIAFIIAIFVKPNRKEIYGTQFA